MEYTGTFCHFTTIPFHQISLNQEILTLKFQVFEQPPILSRAINIVQSKHIIYHYRAGNTDIIRPIFPISLKIKKIKKNSQTLTFQNFEKEWTIYCINTDPLTRSRPIDDKIKLQKYIFNYQRTSYRESDNYYYYYLNKKLIFLFQKMKENTISKYIQFYKQIRIEKW